MSHHHKTSHKKPAAPEHNVHASTDASASASAPHAGGSSSDPRPSTTEASNVQERRLRDELNMPPSYDDANSGPSAAERRAAAGVQLTGHMSVEDARERAGLPPLDAASADRRAAEGFRTHGHMSVEEARERAGLPPLEAASADRRAAAGYRTSGHMSVEEARRLAGLPPAHDDA